MADFAASPQLKDALSTQPVQEEHRNVSISKSKEKVRRDGKAVKQQQGNLNVQEELKKTEVQHFKLHNKHIEVSSKLQKSLKTIEELEAQLQDQRATLTEKEKNLMVETGMRRDLYEQVTKLKPFRERAHVAEGHNKELMEKKRKYKTQAEAYMKKSHIFQNESEAQKIEIKKLSDALRNKEALISNMRRELESKLLQVQSQKEEILRTRKHAEITEHEMKANIQNEENTLKRIQMKDNENISQRREIKLLKDSLKKFEKNKKRQELEILKLKEKVKNVQTEMDNMEKDSKTTVDTLAKRDSEIFETQTVLGKCQEENLFLKNQLEDFKINFTVTKSKNKTSQTLMEKELSRTKDDFRKLQSQNKDIMTENERQKEALYRSESKMTHLQDVIRIQESKITELTKEVFRLTGDAQKFSLVKETYGKVEKLWQADDKEKTGTSIEDILETQHADMLRKNKLATKLKEKETENVELQLQVEKLHFEVEELRRKLARRPDHVVLKLHESQHNIRALKTQIDSLTGQNNAFMTKVELQETKINNLKEQLRNTIFQQKYKLPPISPVLKPVKAKSEDIITEMKKDVAASQSPPKVRKIVYLPPITIHSLTSKRRKSQ